MQKVVLYPNNMENYKWYINYLMYMFYIVYEIKITFKAQGRERYIVVFLVNGCVHYWGFWYFYALI